MNLLVFYYSLLLEWIPSRRPNMETLEIEEEGTERTTTKIDKTGRETKEANIQPRPSTKVKKLDVIDVGRLGISRKAAESD